MAIPFSNIPADWRLPLFFAEVDNSHANSGGQNQPAVIIGQITATGNAVPNVPVLCTGVADAIVKGGQGSMIARMVASYRANDPSGELWLLPLSDAGGAVAAIGTFEFTHVATGAGTLPLYIAGRFVPQPIATTQTLAQLATALAALVNTFVDLPVTAAVDGVNPAMVNLTAKNKGLVGNDVDVRVAYRGSQGGEVVPAGLTYTIVAVGTATAGATNPTLTTALANCADKPFDFIVMPYTDATSLDALKVFLNDATGRWSYDRQVYGQYLAALRGTVGALQTAGAARNDPHGSIMGFYDAPNMCDEWAAAVFGAAAVPLRADPGRPVQTIAVNGLLAPPLISRFAAVDRNTLLHSGISTFTVGADGSLALENVITTYQKNSFNQPDTSFLEIETLYLLMFFLRDQAALVTTRFARMKLAADGTRLAAGSSVVTPKIIGQALIARYRELEFAGIVQQSDAYAAGLIVQINAGNPNRVDVLSPAVLIGQLRMLALLAQFRLS